MKALKKLIFLITITISLCLFLCSCNDSSDESGGSSSSSNSTPQISTGTVLGKVRDSQTSRFLENVMVCVGNKCDFTDIVGGYWLEGIVEGPWSISAEAAGYNKYNNTIQVKGGATNQYDINLEAGGGSNGTKKTKTLYCTEDAYISTGSKDSNYGKSGGLYTGRGYFGGNGTYYYYGFIKFNLSTIPNTATIDKATLYLHTGRNSTTYPDKNGTTYIRRVTNANWTEYGITYNNAPMGVDTIASKATIHDGNTREYSFNVTEGVKDWFGGYSNYGFNLTTWFDNDHDYATFYSREVSQGAGPSLVVEYYE